MPVSGKRSDKNKKSLGAKRAVFSDKQKYGLQGKAGRSQTSASRKDTNGGYFLEDTPAGGAVPVMNMREKRSSAGPLKNSGAYRANSAEKRYKEKKKSIFSVFSAIPGLFSKKSRTSNSSALKFAANRKRLGSKGRRNRRLFIYAGTGLAAAIIMLAVVFVPGMAAPAATQPPGVSPSSTSGQYVAAVTDPEGNVVSGDPSVLPAVSPTPTQTPIVTTPPQVFKPIIDIDDEVQKFRVEADKYYNEVGYSNNHYKYTKEEKSLLSQVMWEEARGEGSKGMIAVGNVVMNRLLSGKFPGNSIKDLVTNGQFARPNGKTNIWSNRAANLVLDYEQWVIPQNIFFFKVPRGDPKADWSPTIKYAFTIGGHAFYTAKKYGRTGMIPPQLFERTFEWPTMGCKPEMRVYKLQYMLNKMGYTKVTPDKYFGQDTKDAIIDFQKKHGLRADGIAGAKTLKEIIKEFGEDDFYEKFCDD